MMYGAAFADNMDTFLARGAPADGGTLDEDGRA
jgi:hypothetical protein